MEMKCWMAFLNCLTVNSWIHADEAKLKNGLPWQDSEQREVTKKPENYSFKIWFEIWLQE